MGILSNSQKKTADAQQQAKPVLSLSQTKLDASGSPQQQHNVAKSATVAKNDSSSTPINGGSGGHLLTAKPSHGSSLRIRTDGMQQQPQSMAAGAASSSHAPLSATPKAAGVGGLAGPTVIKRNTSFSQRLHNLLHRDKSQKQHSATPAQSRRGIAAPETPTIAYRTPTTQTQATDRSDVSTPPSETNSPPSGISPQASAHHRNNSLPKAYHPQRNFEPVPADKVFAVSNINLRSVHHTHHHNQHSSSPEKNAPLCHPRRQQLLSGAPATDETLVHIKQQQQQQQQPAVHAGALGVDDITQGVRQVSLEPVAESRDSSVHDMSREPSQTTLHQNPSASDIHVDTAGASATPASGHAAPAPAPTATAPPRPANGVSLKPTDSREESKLAGKTLPSKPADEASLKLRTVPEREVVAATSSAGATGGTEPLAGTHTPQKKAGPVYSSHKATLNQFGRQTKVIGKGTGGTVRLLQSVDVNSRPPSLRSGPPSSHHGDEPNCYTPSEHRLFAVKEFRKRRQDETPRSYMKKVTSEFCIGSSIHQENVIETLDLIFEGDRVYEIMEYCPHDLFTFVAMGDMDLDETFCWFKQVCQGVQYLHKIGIAHRDLKLENCLLTDRGIVKIIDFGCATVFKTPFQKEPSKVVGVCGSDPYIAPEVLQSRRQLPYYAQVADIWSVGIMYMCMTLLKFPWRIADTENDRNYGSYIRDWPRGREKLFAQLPTLRHDGQKVIEGMVYPDAVERFTMDQVMESDWMKEIDVCHSGYPAKSHTHHMKTE